MSVIRVRAKGTGRVVRWSALRRGELVDGSKWLRLTTVLPDVVTDVLDFTERLDAQRRVTVVVVNNMVRGSLDLAISGQGFEVTCGRRLVRGWFPLNPLAFEFGANFDVVVTINADEAIEASLIDHLFGDYECNSGVTAPLG
ncbi:MAG: hypothetical protein HZB16_09200 [Armatimonadetes bacterium]|nr:hypothetical protein [Armatimonadota bacterium]